MHQTYDPLVEMGEEVDDSEDEALWDELERFMSYINEALEEDGVGRGHGINGQG